MTNELSRRNFMKIAGASAGVAAAAGYSPFSYAQNEKVRVACIGTGGQGGFHIDNGLTPCEAIDIVAVCDVYKPHLNAAWKRAGGEKREVKKYMDYRRLLDEVEFDAAVIATPLFAHHHIVMDCLDADKWVFCEKTLAYDVDECRDIVKKCHETGKFLQVGHQRRYNPEYNKAVWLARGTDTQRSATGRVNHINAHWHRNNDWRRPVPKNYVLSEEEKRWIDDLEEHINWRLYKDRSRGGLITELAVHQLDVCNWFMGTMPTRCAAFGGIDYWRDGREVNDNVVFIMEYDISDDDDGFAMIPERNDLQKFSRINRDYTVRMTWSSICANARREYGEFVQGDRGSIYLTEQKGVTFYPEHAAKEDWNKVEEVKEADADAAADAIVSQKTRKFKDEAYDLGQQVLVYNDRNEPFKSPLSVDRMQFERFAEDIRTGGTPKANQMVGLLSAVAGFAAIEAMEKGTIVDIDPALYAFDFETPDPYRYEFFEEYTPEDDDEKLSKA